jgi:hypothetical protein
MSLPLCRRVSTSVNESPPTQTSLPFRRQDGYTLHIHTADRVGGYNLHVHPAFGVKEYTLHIYIDTSFMSTLQAREMDFTPCMFTVLAVEKGYTLHSHTACNGKKNTSTKVKWTHSHV